MLTRFQQSRGITFGTDTLMKIQAYPEKEASTLILGFRDGSRVTVHSFYFLQNCS